MGIFKDYHFNNNNNYYYTFQNNDTIFEFGRHVWDTSASNRQFTDV